MAADEKLRRITLENGRVVYIGESWLTDMQVFEDKIMIDMGQGVTFYVTGTDIDTFYNATFTISPTEVTITNNPLETHITNDPLDIRELPIELTMNQVNTSVSTTSITLLAANASRKYVFIKNYDISPTRIVYIHFGATATTSNGIPIFEGESYEFPDEFIYTGIITAIISSGASIPVSATEGS